MSPIVAAARSQVILAARIATTASGEEILVSCEPAVGEEVEHLRGMVAVLPATRHTEVMQRTEELRALVRPFLA